HIRIANGSCRRTRSECSREYAVDCIQPLAHGIGGFGHLDIAVEQTAEREALAISEAKPLADTAQNILCRPGDGRANQAANDSARNAADHSAYGGMAKS